MRPAPRTIPRRFAALLPRLCALVVAVFGMAATPERALAQSDKWEVEVAPLYFWAARLDGEVSVNDRTTPVFMTFDDALDKLAGSFALHVGAQKGRWGALADVYFLRLTTDTTFTTPVLSREITGEAKLGMVVVEGGVSYLVVPRANFSVIGGLRTYRLAPKLTFTGDSRQITPIDTSATAVGGFGGFTFRPKLGNKVQFLSRADIGGGEAFTWSSTLGLEYRFTSWAGAMAGFKALGIDTGNVSADGRFVTDVEYATIQYGPIFSLTFHWSQK